MCVSGGSSSVRMRCKYLRVAVVINNNFRIGLNEPAAAAISALFVSIDLILMTRLYRASLWAVAHCRSGDP